MNVLEEILAKGVFRSPQFQTLGPGHVPFDELVSGSKVEQPLRAAVDAGSSVFVVGPRGAGKSSTLAWFMDELPADHFVIRVPVVAMDDPTDPAVFASVAMTTALEAARLGDLELKKHQRTALDAGRADKRVTKTGARKIAAQLGGPKVLVGLSTELASLGEEHTRNALKIDRMFGLHQLVDIARYNKRQPVFVVEDTEAALGAHVTPEQADRFFTASLNILIREIDAPSVIAVQSEYQTSDGYKELRPHVREIELPRLDGEAEGGLVRIIQKHLESHDVSVQVSSLIDERALPFLVAFYDETNGSVRRVFQSLEAAAAAALDADHGELGTGYVRKGIEDNRVR